MFLVMESDDRGGWRTERLGDDFALDRDQVSGLVLNHLQAGATMA